MQMFKDGGGFRRLTQLLQWISLTFKPKERSPLSVRTAQSTGQPADLGGILLISCALMWTHSHVAILTTTGRVW